MDDTLKKDRESIRELRELALQLLSEKIPYLERTMLLRAQVHERGLQMRDGELMMHFAEARKILRGVSDGIDPSMEVDIPEAMWIWEDLIRLGTLNMVVALQKVGKTSVMLQMLRLWSSGSNSFLGSALIGQCPAVIIVGTDMSLCDWRPMLAAAGLMERNPAGKWKLLEPVKKLYTREDALHLDEAGLEKLVRDCEANPGALLLMDSFAAVTGALGIDEFKPAAAEPIYGLCEVVEPHAVTTILIHHSSKSRAGERASNAARGSNSLTAAASQLISLKWHSESEEDHRVVLSTEGRAGRPHHVVIEQIDSCNWILHGDLADVRLKECRNKAEDALSERQDMTLAEVRDLWDKKSQEMDSGTLHNRMPDEYSQSDGRGAAGQTLEQLHKKSLLEKRRINIPGRGMVNLFRPFGAHITEERLSLKTPPLPPLPPSALRDESTIQAAPLPSRTRGKGGKGAHRRESLSSHQGSFLEGTSWDHSYDEDLNIH